jgi:hypothetical protein
VCVGCLRVRKAEAEASREASREAKGALGPKGAREVGLRYSPGGGMVVGSGDGIHSSMGLQEGRWVGIMGVE